MLNPNKKCTSKEHEKIDANTFCQECNIYICKKCENIHSILFQSHHTYNLNEDISQIFTGICKEQHHSDKLKYFCKTHNVLCCAACITKIKDSENGQHSDCSIFSIDDIKEEKKNKLIENIKILENLSLNLQESINEIKKIFEKLNLTKEELKMNVQKIFTKLRNQINDREDEIMAKIEQKFEKLFFKEDMVKECDKLPNKIKLSLDKGKVINNNWNNNKINSNINDCINIENNIKYINCLNENMKKCKSLNLNVKFIPQEHEINNYFGDIKNFGKIIFNNFKFKKCPEKISEKRKYIVGGEEENIITKIGTDREWMGTICDNQLDKSKECIWKIKILKTENYEIMIGVAPKGFNINSSLFNDCGWYYYLKNNTLYSGPPYNYRNKYYSLQKERKYSKNEDKENEKDENKEEYSDSDEFNFSQESNKNKEAEYKEENEEDMPKENEEEKPKEKEEIFEKNDKELTKIIMEITVILNFEKKSLKFIQDNELKAEYINIIVDKPLFPGIFLYNKNDTIEIEGFY